ncbi:MAG: filamentous hemagglutinin family protein [Verrucomicrobiota bacterium]
MCVTLATTLTANGRDILRGGSGGNSVPSAQGIATGASSGAVASQARANAMDAMARTTRALQSVQAMQTAARAAAIAGPNNLGMNPNMPAVQLPNVPNGIVAGGLVPDSGLPAAGTKPGSFVMPPSWRGVGELSQASDGSPGGTTTVNIKQTSQQAILNWNKFNIGKQTKLNFDQSAGGANAGQWIAFNKISDPSGVPSQILGSITAQGQVYVVNQNGIIFGGSSQVNTRALVASSLPINDNLVKQGLLNNRDAQFLFSSVPVPGGPDGTPSFVPAPPPAGKIGAVTVQRGAQISSAQSGDGNGGRVMLVGPEVTNDGTILTPGGQTVLAAGNQIAIAAHASNDPSLRGIDVWVGRVETGAGTATNSGIISAPTGAITIAGRAVNQNGIADSTTSVSLNGRIDLIASYGAVGNPNYDNTGTGASGGPPFLFQNTGTVTFGSGSVTRILPDYESTKTVPGTALPQNSKINVEGLAIHLGQDATILAPSANVSMRAGAWPYADADGNGTTLLADGTEESGLNNFSSGTSQRFLFSGGQIYLDPGALINVAGSTEVFVPLSQSILAVEFRGSEFADSPLQRTSSIRGAEITLDIRRSGVSSGRYWVGTPLGDATGLVGIIERNVAQLTVNGGTVDILSGGSAVVRTGATIDVSGGYYRYEGGMVQTTRLLRGNNLIEIQNAQPSQTYDGIYTGTFAVEHSRWGVTRTFATPWMTGRHYQAAYTGGGNGGTLNLTAASMAVDGTLLGLTVDQPRGVAVSPELSSLGFHFAAERKFNTGSNTFSIITTSPTPPAVTFGSQALASIPAFTLVNDIPVALPAERIASFVLSPALLTDGGFGNLTVENYEGSVLVPAGVPLTTLPHGSITLSGANVSVQSQLTAPGGHLSFTAYAFSPAYAALFPLQNVGGALAPVADGTRGFFTLAPGASLSTRGLFTDDRPGSAGAFTQMIVLNGGSIEINSYSASLAAGSSLDVSSGISIGQKGAATYGSAGKITIHTGRDPGLPTVVGGRLALGSILSGHAGMGANGGTLDIQTGRIQIGGVTTSSAVLLLPADFFSRGGFTNYTLSAFGAPGVVGGPVDYEPAITIAPDTTIRATAETLAITPATRANQGLQFGPVLREEALRSPVNISFSATGVDDSFTPDILEIRADIVAGRGSSLRTDAGGKISFKGQTVSMQGSVFASGGSITISGAGRFPVAPDNAASVSAALPTAVIGAETILSTAGKTVLTPDAYGRRQGTIFPGGTISVSGNIVASAGSVLDVSGTVGTLDVHPSTLGNAGPVLVPRNSGLTAPLWKLKTVPQSIASNGGTIELQGSQMLFTDATLLGHAGGATAMGGTLSVFSGRFYGDNGSRTSADTNLIVKQDGFTIPSTNATPRVGVAMRSESGTVNPGIGYFAADRFMDGGFDSLDLGAKFIDASPISFGGNVEFQGPVSITARGKLRVAAGGVIRANDAVNLTAKYAALGQIFTVPQHPDDQPQLFTQSPATTTPIYTFPPTGGVGSLTVRADLIDIGTLALQGIGNTTFIANNGDIRGNGILSVVGNLTLQAGQVYPPTATSFDIFAYDNGAQPGSVTILGSGTRTAPYSAGGSLRIFASRISQGGTLRAPFGAIELGWDGTDRDPSTTALDSPVNPIAGTKIAAPVTTQVTLQSGSVTSVAAWTGTNGSEMLIPFGLSTDGTSWIDPRGVNVTLSGLPEKRVTIAGTSVISAAGSIVDLRGGGDLYAYRWTAGNGGSADLLGTASAAWSSTAEYQSGDLVTSGGKTWTARVRSGDATIGAQAPVAGRYWSQVAESYAILPGYAAQYAPFAPNNTGANARQLAGDPGYVSTSLKTGDQIYLEGINGLAAGTYTLLPRRYALLPGALLVTPKTGTAYGTISMPDGSSLVSGYRVNAFAQAQTVQTVQTARSQFEVAPASVVNSRVAYDDYRANSFIAAAAARFSLTSVQRLPTDAGSLTLLGGTVLRVEGGVLAAAAGTGRGASFDISSIADLEIIGGTGTASGATGAVLNSATLTAWGAESLLLGGRRYRIGDETHVEARTTNITLNNPGDALMAGDITLLSKARTTITSGSAIAARPTDAPAVNPFTVSGDGTFTRVSSDAGATFTRKNVTASTAPLLSIGAGARITGAGVILDSSYGSAFDPTAILAAQSLDLGSGQISILLGATATLTGSAVPQHLALSGSLLQEVQQVSSLTLRSYRTIDMYGSGTFGSAAQGRLTLFAGGIRGYNQGAATATFSAPSIALGNPADVAALPAPAATSGTLQFAAQTFQFGVNAFSAAGWQNVAIKATGGVLGSGAGSFSTPGNLTIETPLITGVRGSGQSITAGSELILLPLAGAAKVAGGLGAGFTFTGKRVAVGTAIALPSGQLTLHATGLAQAVTVTSSLDVGGVAQDFYDLTRYPDAGTITLISDRGDVNLLAGSTVSVAAATGGGKAGQITVAASQGAFNLTGATLLGGALTGNTTGSFLLDAGSLPSFDALSTALNDGGFFQERSFRIRTGGVTITNPGGRANVAGVFSLSADAGKITVDGTVDASGTTGGKITLISGKGVELKSGSLLTVHAEEFSSAGKGGEIRIEAGAAVNGVADAAAALSILAGSTIDLGVDTYVAGDYLTPGSSAFEGKFTGTLHLRAPRNGNDVQVDALLGNITGASSVIVEGYRLYNPTSGLLNNALRAAINTDANNYFNGAGTNVNYDAMFAKLTTGSPNAAALGQALVIAPGVEIYNNTGLGDLTLGTAVSGLNSEDWNLSAFRYGRKQAPGILTLRAKGDIVFNNTLSDSFTPVTASANNGNSTMWLAPLAPVVTANGLPVNTQSWSYRIAAGSDLSSSDFRSVLLPSALAAGKGSVLVGEFYPAIPNTATTGPNAAVGINGTTENTIQITTGAANRTRFEVVRTGTGDIEIAAGRDVQLRNQFATIYTAGIRIPDATEIYAAGDFVLPIVQRGSIATHPNQGDLGTFQQSYPAQWALAGGSVTIAAKGDIGRFTLSGTTVVPDSSKQLPSNWLYRRGYVDPSTGLFGEGGTGTSGANNGQNVSDASASTAWWIDYSNFFEGIGALGGGNVSLIAGSDIINTDAVIPTNARMPGRDPITGLNIAPDASKLLQYGGGDLTVRAGANIDGGVYYVEKGTGILSAGGEITTNYTRSPSRVYLGDSLAPPSVIQSVSPDVYDPSTWLPTTLFVGDSHFDVSARGDVLLGPVTNAFLLPQGINNKFWYKTYFNTFSSDSGATVASYGGSVTHRFSVTLPGKTTPQPILSTWLESQDLFNNSVGTSSYYQPWNRLAEIDVASFNSQLQVTAPNLVSTAFAGDLNIVGSTTLYPSARGRLELAASDSILGLQVSGRSRINAVDLTIWTSALVNLSDADPANAPGIASPIAYANFAGRILGDLRQSGIDPFGSVNSLFQETGSFTGQAASIVTKQDLHASGLLHTGDTNPVRIYAGGGDVSGLTLFTPKATNIFAASDIVDVAFYIQNIRSSDVSIVASGRDIIPNNPNDATRSLANNASLGNFVGDQASTTLAGSTTNALPGDIQINGPGTLEVLAGRNIDLGTEANISNGTGVGISSIGNFRNPFLPIQGADVVAFSGVTGLGGSGPALGLAGSSLDFSSFVQSFGSDAAFQSAYLQRLDVSDLSGLTNEQQSIVGLEIFFRRLRDAGRSYSTIGNYDTGLAAVDAVLARNTATGSIFTRARDIRTSSTGAISLGAVGGGVTMASDIFGNPLTPPGIVTEYGGAVSIFTDRSVDIGQARIFTLRGGDVVIWSTNGDIAAGTAPKTVVTAPPTRVTIDVTSADVKIDLGGLATGGGIGVLASVAGVKAGDVDLIAPKGTVDAGDAGIRSTGNLNIAATTVLNASNIQVSGSTSGVSSGPSIAAPNIGGLTSASNQGAAASSTASDVTQNRPREDQPIAKEEPPSVISIEILGYGGGED